MERTPYAQWLAQQLQVWYGVMDLAPTQSLPDAYVTSIIIAIEQYRPPAGQEDVHAQLLTLFRATAAWAARPDTATWLRLDAAGRALLEELEQLRRAES
jgi:hypothetical protein